MNVWFLQDFASSEARKATRIATSSGSMKRFKHCPSKIVRFNSGVSQRFDLAFRPGKPRCNTIYPDISWTQSARQPSHETLNRSFSSHVREAAVWDKRREYSQPLCQYIGMAGVRGNNSS